MIRLVIENLRPKIEHRFIFICQQTHIDAYGLEDKLSAWAPVFEAITDAVTVVVKLPGALDDKFLL